MKEEVTRPETSLIPVSRSLPDFSDDLDYAALSEAIRRNLEYLTRISPDEKFIYGPDVYTTRQVIESQKAFLELILQTPEPTRLNREIRKGFKVYRAAGRQGHGKVLFTGYYEPFYEASLIPCELYRYPLYRTPDDLLRIDLSPFGERFKGESITARLEGKKLLPYYSKIQIDTEDRLKGRSLEIAWLKNPLDVAFLHIQGSGKLKLPDNAQLSVGYQASNGLPYRSIGKLMIDRGFITREEASMQSIRAYLSTHPETLHEILNLNPSYIFFRIAENGPFGNINVPLTPGRSLALDAKLFPKGALAFVTCRKPILDNHGRIGDWVEFSRFMLNQDTGGAIKGPGRADLFWGAGPYAESAAGHLKDEGHLFILIKK
jgi:membrane-bound lytic murein transglycosylase A